MRHRGFMAFGLVLACLFVFSLVISPSAEAAPFTQENRPENLQALFELMLQSLYVKKDPKEAATLFRGLVPDQNRMKKALKDDVSSEVVQKILDKFQQFGMPSEANIDRMLPAGTGVVKVYGATTEEIAAYKDGSGAFKHFAGGAKKAAQQILRPKMTFYQVVVSSPEQKSSITYHLFYWDGQQWSMLAKPWQVLP